MEIDNKDFVISAKTVLRTWNLAEEMYDCVRFFTESIQDELHCAQKMKSIIFEMMPLLLAELAVPLPL